MKISLQELRSFEDFIQRLEDGAETRYVYPKGHPLEDEALSWGYYANHPHFLMVAGFDEYVAFKNKKSFRDLWFANSMEDTGQTLYRKPSGQWLILYVPPWDRNASFYFHSKKTLAVTKKTPAWNEKFALEIPLQDLFKKLYSIAGYTISEEKTLWSPVLWTPSAQERQNLILRESTRGILSALKSEQISLSSLSWRQLEDIVAEVLRAHGLEIHVVRENPQGGRDIIARGELIPGQEPLAMAIEVKHRKVVDRPEVEKALYQNRRFPALMFVTSGRFTAGVLKEKALPENKLRLFLKDGEALGDLIHDYKLIQ